MEGFVGPKKLESSLQRILLVQIFPIANVVVDIRLELRFYIREHMFRNNKVYWDVVLFPDGPLSAKRTVRTTADQIPLLLGSSYHLHSQDSRRVAYLQGAVYVKTYQYHQVGSSPQCVVGVCLTKYKAPAGRMVRSGNSKDPASRLV